ncbi:rhamnan synthesis F family protein [Aminobacter carboxidus]|uniref:Lipopolysaccharide biosynthesis protein n=1 Tax=Aminobacter carboxidus TaxID=376165 RepID=A0A8E1WHY3_9HYPH|nr:MULTISPECIES: rhamnan synthesis F family protein [Aminobacter carboxidus group]MBB6468224.1 lipopolysaccharide biosynthesis protein [Aminobacter lissarensis]MBE1205357.1 hypothetical protein [Aminobacter carboxidus]
MLVSEVYSTGAAAIVVHAFYPDVFEKILDLVCLLPKQHKLFVTTVAEHEAIIQQMLEQSGRVYSFRVMKNRGRDVLPFLKIFPQIRAQGFNIVVKLHTKKSPHRGDGHLWARDIHTQLLNSATLARAVEAFAVDSSLGMLGPEGHFVSMSAYLGANKCKVLSIGSRLGLSEQEIQQGGFFAGTMFMARADAFDPLVRLAFDDEEFEPEAGQTDGTLAHALERAMALSVTVSGMRIASVAEPASWPTINRHYVFAKKKQIIRGLFKKCVRCYQLGLKRMQSFVRSGRI